MVSYKRHLRGLTLLVSESQVDNINITQILVTLGRLVNIASIDKRPNTLSLGIEFNSETTGYEFHIMNHWLVRLTQV